MVLDLIRRSFGDLRAEVHTHDMGADLHDEIHVMFYDEDRQFEIRVNGPDQRVQRENLFGVHSGRRLVKQQQFRVQRERTGNLQTPLVSVRERPRSLVRSVGESNPFEQFHALLPYVALFAPPPSEVRHSLEEGVGDMLLRSGHDILQNRGTLKQPQVLKGSGNPFVDNVERLQRNQVLTAEENRPLVGIVDAGYKIEDRSLARSVRSHKACQLALRN